MIKPKILFVGCSFTENSGFNAANQPKFHWPWLVSQEFDANFVNVGIGGSSNQEIFDRAVENCCNGCYDLVVVIWSEINRHWVYWSQNNVDDYTIINHGTVLGLGKDKDAICEYAKLHYTYFNNQYVNFKKWLLMIVALGNFFENQRISYVFGRAFENGMQEIEMARYAVDSGFIDTSDWVRQILDFDNRPDYFIKEKLESIQILLAKVKKLNWIEQDFSSWPVHNDLADDRLHMGIKSNKIMADQIVQFCNNILRKS